MFPALRSSVSVVVCAAVVAGSLVGGCYAKHAEPELRVGGKGRQPSDEASPNPDRDAAKPGDAALDASRASGAREAGAARSPEDPIAQGSLAPTEVQPAPNLRVAFIGDQSISESARAVLQLIERERAAMVVHAGDLSYGMATPRGWEAQIDDVLGANFPYLVAAGNHDLDDWTGPQGFDAVLTKRLARTPGLVCIGELGLQQLCRYRGLEIVLSAVGTTGSAHEWYLERTLARPGALIRLCIWHKNQHDMQVGDKTDEVGWNAYEICAKHGAPIITGHEHSYARTYTLTAVGDRSREHGRRGPAEVVTLSRGSTFVVVSGLGGHSSRTRTFDHANDTWWASIYANDFQMMNGRMMGKQALVEAGALFIDFHVDGDPTKARAYFKTISERVVDRFELKFERGRADGDR